MPPPVNHSKSSRTPMFDGQSRILSIEDVQSKFQPHGIWINIEHASFYTQFHLSMKNYISSVSEHIVVNYISSPDVSFLKSLHGRVQGQTKLIFHFPHESTLKEPSTNMSYVTILQNLTFVKSFACGILVSKKYIVPVSWDNYLNPSTSIVSDAHEAGLEIYASDFVNDGVLSYNYSFDPVSEILAYIDNGDFSVDGVVTDFPITPTEAIGCFININRSNVDHGKPIIISQNGASGDYPGCSDMAYEKAVSDGADVIDCPVQVTKDGILICMSSNDMLFGTAIRGSMKYETSADNQVVHTSVPGLYTFNFTWDEIVSNFIPRIYASSSSSTVERNPRFNTAGNFMRLSDFLGFARDKNLFGIMITIKLTFYDLEQPEFDITRLVINTLNEAGYNDQTTKRVMIQSEDSSVLLKFREETSYDRVYMIIGTNYQDIEPSALVELKKFATAVSVPTGSVISQVNSITINQTELVRTLQNAGLPVYVYDLMNEYSTQPLDFLADPTVQIDGYVTWAGVDGLVTDFPATARRYKSRNCMGKQLSFGPGSLLKWINESARPRLTERQQLTDGEIAEAPLPSGIRTSIASRTHAHCDITVSVVSWCIFFIL